VGPSPFALRPDPDVDNPILQATDVTDVNAEFVADPFLIRRDGTWHVFFEVMPSGTRHGVIGHATSDDALAWSYQGVVLVEPFHLSYPHVFSHDGEVYMTPEAYSLGSVALYRADPFPQRWRRIAEPVAGQCVDPTPFEYGGRWWMFVSMPLQHANPLRLFHADRLTGPWREHGHSPIVVGDPRRSRPAGRVVRWDGRLYRFAQDGVPDYGTAVRAFQITELTAESYAERPTSPEVILAAGEHRWNSGRVHHVDAHPAPDGTWIACVDGTEPVPRN
jgi:hypothetical protein